MRVGETSDLWTVMPHARESAGSSVLGGPAGFSRLYLSGTSNPATSSRATFAASDSLKLVGGSNCSVI